MNIFLLAFAGALLANIITVGCNFSYNYWRAKQRHKEFDEAFERASNGFDRLLRDIYKDDKPELRH